MADAINATQMAVEGILWLVICQEGNAACW